MYLPIKFFGSDFCVLSSVWGAEAVVCVREDRAQGP